MMYYQPLISPNTVSKSHNEPKVLLLHGQKEIEQWGMVLNEKGGDLE